MTGWVSTAPLRADLAGGTLDIWPLSQLHPGSSTVNVALHIRATARYRAGDGDWRLRRLTFAVADAEDTAVARTSVASDGAGHWRVDERERPDLEGCLDVDIQITPFTNTLPIRRLGDL